VPVDGSLLISSNLTDKCVVSGTSRTLWVGIRKTSKGRTNQHRNDLKTLSSSVPLVITMFAHEMHAWEIQLTIARSTACDLKYLGTVDVCEAGYFP
jgi:hypothetical protein